MSKCQNYYSYRLGLGSLLKEMIGEEPSTEGGSSQDKGDESETEEAAESEDDVKSPSAVDFSDINELADEENDREITDVCII